MKHQLLVGINYVGQDAELRGCVNDICDVNNYLGAKGFTGGCQVLENTPLPPTKKVIVEEMRKFIAVPAAMKYVHYSGHGSQLRDENGDEVDSRDECICPIDIDWNAPDNNFIRDDELNKILVRGLPDGCKLRVLFDSCHSGSALDLPFRCDENGFIARENKSKPCGDVIFISGCKDFQTSADAQFGSRANGALTKAFLTILAEKGDTPLTWRQLVERMRAWLVANDYDQVPQLDASKVELFDTLVDM
jgi:hypothetical protein